MGAKCSRAAEGLCTAASRTDAEKTEMLVRVAGGTGRAREGCRATRAGNRREVGLLKNGY